MNRFNWVQRIFCCSICFGQLLLCALFAGCGGEGPKTPDEPAAQAAEPGKHILFEYPTLDKKTVSTASLSGRFSVLGFITTYDAASQLQARQIHRLLHKHKPRINAVLFILEAPENRPMAEAFVSVLKLDCPVVMADQALLLGTGPFEGMHSVPSLLILDRQGREAFRYHGVLDENGLENALQTLEKQGQSNTP